MSIARSGGLDFERIDFAQVYHSATEGPHEPVQAVIRNNDELRRILPEIALPAFDFANQQLIVAALGETSKSDSDVHITSVMYFTDRLQGRPPLISITYAATAKGGSINEQYRPIHVVSTRRLEGDVEFQKNVERG